MVVPAQLQDLGWLDGTAAVCVVVVDGGGHVGHAVNGDGGVLEAVLGPLGRRGDGIYEPSGNEDDQGPGPRRPSDSELTQNRHSPEPPCEEGRGQRHQRPGVEVELEDGVHPAGIDEVDLQELDAYAQGQGHAEHEQGEKLGPRAFLPLGKGLDGD